MLSDENQAFAIYLRATGTKKTTLNLETGEGQFEVRTMDTRTGSWTETINLNAKNGSIQVVIDIPLGELAVEIIKKS